MNQIKKLEQEWFNSQPRYKARELLEIFPEVKEYLEDRQRYSLICINTFEDIIKYKLEQIAELKDELSQWFSEEVLKITDGAILEKHEKRIKYINYFLNPFPEKEGSITDEHIKIAKEYPFEDLLQFNKQGFANCPFHNEKTASFHIRNNYCYCFGCGWKGDTIKFVMEHENLDFISAVKKLQ